MLLPLLLPPCVNLYATSSIGYQIRERLKRLEEVVMKCLEDHDGSVEEDDDDVDAMEKSDENTDDEKEEGKEVADGENTEERNSPMKGKRRSNEDNDNQGRPSVMSMLHMGVKR